MNTDGLTDKRPLTVAVIEDDARVRRSLVSILLQIPDCECAGEYGSGEEAVDGLAKNPARVVVIDVNLPGINGVECVRQLALILPDVQMLMLTVHEDTDTIFDALAAGATGYLLKPVRSRELIEAVLDISRGGAPMSSSIARKVVQTFRHKPSADSAENTLSSRETEVLDMLAKGHLYKEIADHLEISYSTVQTHIERIYKKLHVHSRAQAVAIHLQK